MKYGSKLLAGILFQLAASLLLALDPSRSLTQYSQRFWNTENGLPQASIHDVLQTRDGFLWIATQEGLVRFDGVQHILYEEAFTPGLAANYIHILCEDAQGGLWMGTIKGLSRYFDHQFQSFGIPDGLPDKNVVALAADPDGSLWIGTSSGLARWSRGKLQNLATGNAPYSKEILALAVDSAHRLWVGTRQGLYRSQALDPLRLQDLPAFSGQRISAFCEDRKGIMWVGSDEGLHRLKGDECRRYTAVQGMTSKAISALQADRQGNIWIGTNTSGLFRLSGEKFSAINTRNGFPDDWIYSLCEDSDSNLWVGTSIGLVYLQDGSFTCIGTPEGLSNDVVFALFQGRDKSLWVGTNQGLNHLTDGVVTRYSTLDGLSHNAIDSICETQRGDVWVGTDSGLNCLRKGRFVPFPGQELFANLMVYSILLEPSGSLWFSTSKGGFHMEGSRITRYDSRNALPGDRVNFIVNDRGGNTWFSVYSKGLACRHADGTFSQYSEQEGLASNLVNAIHEERDGTLWFATMNGLSRFQNGRFSSLTRKNGLFNDSIYIILEDQLGYFWMSSNRGIFRMAKADLHAVANGIATSAPCSIFDRKDGMRTAECNSSGLQVGIADDRGLFWFATMKGVAIVDPKRLQGQKHLPRVMLEEFSVSNHRFHIPQAGLSAPLVLKPSSRNFTFRFTSPYLQNPKDLILKYILEGYDPYWQTAGSERLVRYTNLPRGEYRFRVIAGNSDSNWNFKGISLPFRVRPFFYETPLFFILAFLVLVLLIIAAIYFRTRHLQKKERELQTKITERTEQLARVNEQLRLSNISLAQQISERETFERRLQEAYLQLQDSNAKLKELDRLKTDFINITSHELRTPLTSVLGFACIIRRRLSELFDGQNALGEKKRQDNIAKIRENIEIIVTEGQRLTILINDMLDIAKMEAGRMEWRKEKVSVDEIIKQALATTSSLFEGKKLTVQSYWEENLPIIHGDRNRLLQVLINLLSNAVKFTDEGTVTITVRKLGDDILIKVRDTGRGIAPEDLPFIFQKFKQLGARSGESQGSGLGLVICKEIVEYHRGVIHVESAPGKGTEFTVTLPGTPPENA